MHCNALNTAVLPQKGRRLCLLLLTIGGLAMFTPLLNLQAATAFTGCGGEVVTAANAQAEAQVVELVNAERAKAGLPPYKAVAELIDAARYHSADMAADRYRDHYTYDRDAADTLVKVCTWTERVKKYYPDFDQFTENVGNGTASPQTIMNAWMASTGHKANILGNYREIGVGYASLYWTQDFTTRYTVYPLIINREARQTTTPAVSLYVYGSWAEMRLRNDGGLWSDWQTFQNEVAWTLANEAGLRLVEIEMRSGQTTASSSDTIELVLGTTTATPTRTPVATNTPTITQTPTAAATTIPTLTATLTPTITALPTLTATVTPTATPFQPPTPQAVATATPISDAPLAYAIYLPCVRR